MTIKVPLPIKQYAKELSSYLLEYFIPENHFRVGEKAILGVAMENLLINLVKVVIQDNADSKMPRESSIDEEEAFAAFAEATRLNADVVHGVLNETILLENFLDFIYQTVSKSRWDIWTVSFDSSIFMENHGDFRVLQWEEEHMVNGVYYADYVEAMAARLGNDVTHF